MTLAYGMNQLIQVKEGNIDRCLTSIGYVRPLHWMTVDCVFDTSISHTVVVLNGRLEHIRYD